MGKSPVKKPVSVTDNLPFTVAVPETSALSQLLELTLQRIVPPGPKSTSPLMVSVPVGASVPSMVVPLVVLTVPLPVSVPDFHA